MHFLVKGKALSTALVCLSLAWCILATAAVYLFPTVFESLNWRMYDGKMSLVPRPEPSGDIVHVDVDDPAMAVKQYGPWPWSRALSGRIVQRLSDLGAKAIVFDVLYTTHGRVSEEDEIFFESIRKAGNVVSATGLGITQPRDGKKRFLGEPGRMDALYDKCWQVKEPVAQNLPCVWVLDDSFVPLKPIIEESRQVGHIKSTPDRDGVHRRVPLLVRLEQRYVPSLALATLSACGIVAPQEFSMETANCVRMRHGNQLLEIPVDSRGMMLVNWTKPWDGGFKHYSVLDVLSEVPDLARSARYRDKIVIVAVTGTGSTDIGPTPLGAEFPLSRVHSNALSTILTNQFIPVVEPYSVPVVAAWLLAIPFAMVTGWLSLRNAIIAGSVLWVLSVVIPLACFAALSYEIPMAEFYTIFVPSMLVSLIYTSVNKESAAVRTAAALKKYLSPKLVERIVAEQEELDLSTKRRELSVLFADIEDFSHMSETVELEYLTRFLNEFFDSMTRVIFAHQGTVDKFLGDGIRAFFGDPVTLENHALAAVRAAIDMHREMAELSSRWTRVGVQEFQRGVRMRIGVSTGMVVVGNIGSARRMEYTVIGLEINVASKIRSKAPAGGIVITSRTHALTRHAIPCSAPETLSIKGLDRPVEVYLVDPSVVQDRIDSTAR